MLDLHVGYSRHAVGYICTLWQAHFFQGQIAVMQNICNPVLPVTSLIVVSSYEAYIVR